MQGIYALILSLLVLLSLSSVNALNQLSNRALVDVCADVNAGLDVPNPLDPSHLLVVGIINACLCVSALPTFIETNIVAIAAVALVGESTVSAALTALINAAPDHQSCSYPEYATPVCRSGSPCGFTCSNGFTPSPASHPTQCVCDSPKHVCNGVCGSNPCPSSNPRKRDVQYWGKSMCTNGLTACGVYGGSARAWECIDTDSDLESCGGCSLTLGPSQPGPRGVDCTTLHGVSDVACVSGSCVVQRCMDDFQPSADGASCIKSSASRLDGLLDDLEFLAAVEYNPEHIPLWKN